MKKGIKVTSLVGDHLGCFGRYSADDLICKKFCAINLQCSVERDQNCRLEILQELAFSDDLHLKMQ